MLYVITYLLLTLGIENLAPLRWQMVWELPWLTLDCIGSVLIRERFGTTLSAKAWDAREHARWDWTHKFIDYLFGSGHCEVQWLRERHYGSVWQAWKAQWRGETFTADTQFADTQPHPEA